MRARDATPTHAGASLPSRWSEVRILSGAPAQHVRGQPHDARREDARALRPFILRRTKREVARDLPAKPEQVIYCELDGPERKQYDELRAYYRASLLGMVDEHGMARTRMHILEALLRLRQAAFHPGLLDSDRVDDKSAKLNALTEQLDDVVAGGHKALVFSQFTSLLAIVKRHLDGANIRYQYLDDKTRDRQERVDRFAADADCPVFLLSLKAGGVGLNLTAAEYVFLLDPWSNPAVEAQAIDRTHRIGQSRAVFAYRLIGRDTIEDKVLAFQAQKKQLAEAINHRRQRAARQHRPRGARATAVVVTAAASRGVESAPGPRLAPELHGIELGRDLQ